MANVEERTGSKWSLIGYWCFGIVCLLCFMLAMTPLHFVWQHISPLMRGMPISLEQPRGTIWNGYVVVRSPQLESVTVEWSLSPVQLFMASPTLQVSADSAAMSLSGLINADLNIFERQVSSLRFSDVNGMIDGEILQPILLAQRINFSGNTELSDIAGEFSLTDRVFSDVQGRIVYTGGNVKFPVERTQVSATLPLLVGQAGMNNGNAEINLQTESGDALAKVFLQPDGWGGAAVRRRALDLVNQPWQDKNATADTVVFEVSQKIL